VIVGKTWEGGWVGYLAPKEHVQVRRGLVCAPVTRPMPDIEDRRSTVSSVSNTAMEKTRNTAELGRGERGFHQLEFPAKGTTGALEQHGSI